jgi:hypothetical protein
MSSKNRRATRMVMGWVAFLCASEYTNTAIQIPGTKIKKHDTMLIAEAFACLATVCFSF